MLTFLSELTTYLNSLGYQCDAVQTMVAERILCDLKSPEEAAGALKCIYAKTPQEFHAFEHDFLDFFRHREERMKSLERRQKMDGLNEKRRRLNERRIMLGGKYGSLREKEHEIRQKYREKREALKEQKEKSLSDCLEEYRKQKVLTRTEENFILKHEAYLKGHPLESALKGIEEVTEDLLAELQEKAESALYSGDLETFEKDNKIFNIARKLMNREETLLRKAKNSTKKAFDNQEKQLDLDEEMEVADLWREIRAEEARLEEEERRIKNALKKVSREEENFIQKGGSRTHRETFTGGQRSVQAANDGELSKEFELLSSAEAERIRETIHQESLRLKTRLRKISRTNRRESVDLRRTVRASIRTGGEITKLLYRRKKPSKADMVLMLDISGSCSKAAKMLISFAYSLKDAFPNGCRVYAFVNKLFDITEIMEADNVAQATQAVFDTIPTRGVYSDYYVPLESFWSREKNRLGRESFVMIMGDARNNKNPTGEYYVQQIQRKCPHSYFLCTEPRWEWGSGDSIADLYSMLIRTVPVTRTTELMDFISTVV